MNASVRVSVFSAALALIAMLLLTSCASPTSRASASPQPQATVPPTLAASTATPVFTPLLGQIPAQCPISTTSPQPKFSPDLSPVIGASPVWATWSPGPNRFHLVLPSPYPSTYASPYGWDMSKVVWEVGPNYSEPVTIGGYDVFDHTPLLLQTDSTPTNPVILDPHHPNHAGSALGLGWAEWGSYIVVPKAGCYRMVVSWPQGSWSVTFAAGA
jgi:hypothetical protein